MKQWIYYYALILLIAAACANDKNGDEVKGYQFGDDGVSNADFIRNPVTADKEIDPDQAAKMEFDTREYDFGTVAEGEIVEKIFAFTNTGNAPLLISDAASSCGCTVPEYPKEAIPKGGKGEIKVRFDSNGREGTQLKVVTVRANTYPSANMLTLKGIVSGSSEKPKQ